MLLMSIIGFTPNPPPQKYHSLFCLFSVSTSTWGSVCTTDTEHYLFQSQTNDKISRQNFYIRPATKEDIPQIVEITIDAFSNPTYDIRPYLVQSEQNRYMNNLPHSEQKDRAMFVAVSSVDRKQSGHEIILGFVDLDGRMPAAVKPSDPPRPYLSDLAVHLNFRRQGIATALMDACEKKAAEWGYQYIYLRAEKNRNALAKEIYFSKGYTYIEHHYFGVENRDDTMLLRLDLSSLTTH